MKKIFKIVYNRLENAKLEDNILCSKFWHKIIKLHKTFNERECWKLMTENIEWLINSKDFFKLEDDIITTEEIKQGFTEEELNNHNIYTKGNITVSNGLAIGLGNVKIEANGHSKVVLFDKSFADCFDTSFVTGFHDSSFKVTDCIGTAFHNCKSEAIGLSIIENWTKNKVKKGVNCLVVNRS